jgi:LacI family transcriptional regulator
MKKVTLQNIADQLGVTKVTVGKALSNQPGVGDVLRRKILGKANEMGYVAKRKAHGLSFNSIAFIIHTHYFNISTEDFYTRIFSHFNRICQDGGCIPSLFVLTKEEIEQMAIPKQLGECGGIVVAGELPEPYLFSLCSMGIPLVMLDSASPHMQKDCVVVNNFQLGYLAAMHLIDKGHTRLGFISKDHLSPNVTDRLYGFRKALDREGIALREDWLLSNTSKRSTYYTLNAPLPGDMPTAFVCHCDMAAYFMIQTLTAAGYNVPEDISIISFDNTNLAGTCVPPLTSFDISKEQFAVYAYELLLNRIANPGSDYRTLYIDTKLIERDSVAERKGGAL